MYSNFAASEAPISRPRANHATSLGHEKIEALRMPCKRY